MSIGTGHAKSHETQLLWNVQAVRQKVSVVETEKCAVSQLMHLPHMVETPCILEIATDFGDIYRKEDGDFYRDTPADGCLRLIFRLRLQGKVAM